MKDFNINKLQIGNSLYTKDLDWCFLMIMGNGLFHCFECINLANYYDDLLRW
jgi:hypothetical protein